MDSTRKFFGSVTLLVILNLLIKPIWIFAIDRQVQNQVGTEVYGAFFALFNLSIIFNFLPDLGLTVYFNKSAAENQQFIADKFSWVIRLKAMLSLGYGAILLLLGYISGIENIWLLVLLGLFQVMQSYFLFLRSNVTSLQMFSKDAWLSVMDKGMVIIICGAMIYFPHIFGSITIEKFLYVQLFTVAASCVYAWLLIPSFEKKDQELKINYKEILSLSLPYAATIFFMSLMSRADGFLLERLHPNGAFESGKYAEAYRIMEAGNMVGYLFASFLLPFIAHHLRNKEKIQMVILQSRELLLTGFFIIVALVAQLSPWIHNSLYGSTTDKYSSTLLLINILSLGGYYLVHLYGTVLTASGKINILLRVTILFAIVNLILNIFLIPQFGALACSVIALVTQAIYGLVLIFLVKKEERISFRWMDFSKAFLAGIVTFFITWFLSFMGVEELYVAGLTILLAGSYLILIKGASIADLWSLLGKK